MTPAKRLFDLACALILSVILAPVMLVIAGLILIRDGWIATLIVNLNPVSFLATAADYDYLLATWFYQRTAFGSLRYEFWPPAIFVISCLAIMLFSVIYLTVSNRRDVGRTAPDGWRKNT